MNGGVCKQIMLLGLTIPQKMSLIKVQWPTVAEYGAFVQTKINILAWILTCDPTNKYSTRTKRHNCSILFKKYCILGFLKITEAITSNR